MLMEECSQRLGQNGGELGAQEAAMRDYVAGSAHMLASRQPGFQESEQARLVADHERAVELENARRAQARAVRKQMRAERRASLSPAGRVRDGVHELRRLRAVWLVLGFVVAAVVALGAGIATKSPRTLALCGGLYIVAIMLGRRAVERRQNQKLPDGFNDRVSDQLDRVRAAVPAASAGQLTSAS